MRSPSIEQIVEPLDVAKSIRAQGHVMVMGTCQAYLVLLKKWIKRKRHFKAPVLAQGNARAVHQGLANIKDSGARRFFSA